MKKSHAFSPGLKNSNGRILQTIWLAALTLLISSIMACNTPKNQQYDVLKIYGNGEVANFTKSFAMMSTQCSMTQPGGLMVEEGDLLSIEGWTITYQSSLLSADKAIHFVNSDSLLVIDGQLAGLCIDTAYEVSKMLRGIDKMIVQNLKVLAISNAGFDVYKKEIKELAAINPKCGLILGETFSNDALAELLGWFSPNTLNATLSGQQHQLLKTESQLASLFISNRDSILMAEPLPALPNLKSFIHHFDGDSISTAVRYNQFLANNSQLEKVSLFNWNADSGNVNATGILQPLKNIRELTLEGMQVADGEILAQKGTLEKLVADNEYLQLQMPRLRWASISEQQAIFDSLIASKQSLQVLEITGPEDALDLQHVNQLKGLQALILVHADSTKISPLFQLKALKFLSYSLKKGNSDSTIQVLRAALPNTLVVPNDGFCVGSGYLMLLLPMLAIALLLANRRQKRNQAN